MCRVCVWGCYYTMIPPISCGFDGIGGAACVAGDGDRHGIGGAACVAGDGDRDGIGGPPMRPEMAIGIPKYGS